MKAKHINCIIFFVSVTLIISACRTSKHTTAAHTSTTSITQSAIDSAAHRLMASQSRRLTITYIPGFQITTPDLPIPRTNSPLQDLTNQLIEQGGGTLIIEEETAQTHDQTTTNIHISTQDTTTTQNTQYQEKQTQQPRASPILNRLIILIIAATIFIMVLKLVIRQTHTV
ncbi:MAG: hypothetical protein IJU24_08220 [Bacteroidaceae bacterium]|nr:hypothetical protein [Bacteroidaceae bacterium]